MDHLQTETRNPASMNLDQLTSVEIVRLMNDEDARVIPAVASQADIIAKAIDVIADRLQRGGRLIYVGAGTSGRLGVLDATECPPTFSTPPEIVVGLIAGGPPALTRAVEGAEDRPEFAEQDLRAINLAAGDVLVGIATSGRTPYVHSALEYARRLGAFTIAFSCNPDSDIIPLADLAITPVVGPEVLTGSTRLKAGTATKLVLNMLTTGAMVRLGKAYGNLMVDLKATNSKLRARTNRIIRQLAGVSQAEADHLLQQCGGELKTALVAKLGGLSPEGARGRLQSAGGRVRTALEPEPRPSLQAGAVCERLVIGIDGGGTKTVALLARLESPDTETILGRGEAGSSNVRGTDAASALQALDHAVHKAFAAAGLPRQKVSAACLGLAGAGRDEERQVIHAWARRIGLADKVEVTTDAAILLAAGTPEGWGLVIVAGTGSIAFGKTKDGRTARAGGWGPLLGDEGSAYRIVVDALRAAARWADGIGQKTSLLPTFLDGMGLARPEALIGAVHGSVDRRGIAALAPLVFKCADNGDATAQALIRQHSGELAECAAAVVKELQLENSYLPLALAGGLLLASDGYRDNVLKWLQQWGLSPKPLTLVETPARGAIKLARSVIRASA